MKGKRPPIMHAPLLSDRAAAVVREQSTRLKVSSRDAIELMIIAFDHSTSDEIAESGFQRRRARIAAVGTALKDLGRPTPDVPDVLAKLWSHGFRKGWEQFQVRNAGWRTIFKGRVDQ